jgi:hypothetical protein
MEGIFILSITSSKLDDTNIDIFNDLITNSTLKDQREWKRYSKLSLLTAYLSVLTSYLILFNKLKTLAYAFGALG